MKKNEFLTDIIVDKIQKTWSQIKSRGRAYQKPIFVVVRDRPQPQVLYGGASVGISWCIMAKGAVSTNMFKILVQQ